MATVNSNHILKKLFILTSFITHTTIVLSFVLSEMLPSLAKKLKCLSPSLIIPFDHITKEMIQVKSF